MAAHDSSSNYAHHVLQSLQRRPDKTILIVSGESVTGLQLHERVTCAAQLLQWQSVAPGDRILITMTPSVDFFAAALATLAIGGCIVVIDPAMGYDRCDHCIATAKPSAWLWKKGARMKYLKYFLPSFRSIKVHLPVGSLTPSPSLPPHELLQPQDCVPVDHALVTFTTGSTGLPKLMLRRHAFLLNQSRSVSLSYETVVQGELERAESEASYATNLTMFCLHFLKVGSLSVLYPNIQACRPAEVIATLKRHSITALFGSPAFVERIAAHALSQGSMLPVDYVMMGGAPVYKGLMRTVTSATPEKRALVIYGSTEAEPIAMVFAAEKLRAEATGLEGMCVGLPVFPGSVKIVRPLRDVGMEPPPLEPLDIAAELEVGCGEVGEILLSGWHVNTYQVDGKRLVRDTDGSVWLRSEDAGWMDEEGRVWLVGRAKWRVRRAGRSHWSYIVEQKVMDRCSLITFAAYLPHPLRPEEAWLFVEAPKGLPDKERAGLQSLLSREGIPVDRLEVRPKIPRDRRHASKPDTAALFRTSSPNSLGRLLSLVLRANPRAALGLVLLQLLFIPLLLLLLLWP